jgi:hypothetical protein
MGIKDYLRTVDCLMEKLWKIKELNNQPKMVKLREFFIKKHEALTGQKGDSTTQKIPFNQ